MGQGHCRLCYIEIRKENKTFHPINCVICQTPVQNILYKAEPMCKVCWHKSLRGVNLVGYQQEYANGGLTGGGFLP